MTAVTPPTPEGLPGDGWVRYMVDDVDDLSIRRADGRWGDTGVDVMYFDVHPDSAPPRPTEGWQMPEPLRRPAALSHLTGWWDWGVFYANGEACSVGIEPTEEAALAAQEAARVEWDRKLAEHGEVE